MIAQPNSSTSHQHRDVERLSYMLRADLLFAKHENIHCVTGNACGEGLFCLSEPHLSEHHAGESGTCQIFIGKEYFEIPFLVVRSDQHGLAVKLHHGDNQQFQQAFRRINRTDSFFAG